MNVVMKRPNSATATKARRAFLGSLRFPCGDLLDLDFDNDNEKPITAEPLDWDMSRAKPRLT